MNLAELTARTGLDVLDHLETQVAIPVLDGLQAQGDLLVIPFDVVADAVIPPTDDRWRPVPHAGIEVLRGAAGGNPHTLTAEHGTCHWTDDATDHERLTLGMLCATRPVYLIHPEHGASGIAPGMYVIRRQRERAMENRRRWTGTNFSADPDRYIAD